MLDSHIIHDLTNEEIVGRCLNTLRSGLIRIIEVKMRLEYGQNYLSEINDEIELEKSFQKGSSKSEEVDIGILLNMIQKRKDTTYKDLRDVNYLLFEMRIVRNRWAHLKVFDDSDTFRALDGVEKILSCGYKAINEECEELTIMSRFKQQFILKMAENVKKRLNIQTTNQDPPHVANQGGFPHYMNINQPTNNVMNLPTDPSMGSTSSLHHPQGHPNSMFFLP